MQFGIGSGALYDAIIQQPNSTMKIRIAQAALPSLSKRVTGILLTFMQEELSGSLDDDDVFSLVDSIQVESTEPYR